MVCLLGSSLSSSRGTLRMNGVGEKERERGTRLGCVVESGDSLFFFFLLELLYSKLVHF